jgi:hypothetical protein
MVILLRVRQRQTFQLVQEEWIFEDALYGFDEVGLKGCRMLLPGLQNAVAEGYGTEGSYEGLRLPLEMEEENS